MGTKKSALDTLYAANIKKAAATAPDVKLPYEYPSDSGGPLSHPVATRKAFTISSGFSLAQTGPSSASSDQSFTGNMVSVDCILTSASISAAIVGGSHTNPTIVSLRIYRNGGTELAYELAVQLGVGNAQLADQPNIVLYAGDVVKVGRYFNLPASSSMSYTVSCTCQPFR